MSRAHTPIPAPRAPLVPRACLAIVAVWGAMVAALSILRPTADAPGACLFRAVSGIPCPTCGGTRAVWALAAGDAAGAVALNPLVVVSPALIPLAVVASRAGRRGPAAPGARRARVPWPALILVGVLANWAYVLSIQ